MAGRVEAQSLMTLGDKQVKLCPCTPGSFFKFEVVGMPKDKYPIELTGLFTTEAEALKAVSKLKARRAEEYKQREETRRKNSRAKNAGAEA